MRDYRQDNYKAFSLLELVVAMSLVALVAGLLFPVFSRAMEKVRQRACLYNLKLIGVATSMYLEDNDQVYPAAWSGCTGTQGWRMTTWQWQLEPYVQAGVTNDAQGDQSEGNWADSGGQFWHCPADIQGSSMSYGLNAMIAGAYPQTDCSNHVQPESWEQSEAQLYTRYAHISGGLFLPSYLKEAEALSHTRYWEKSEALPDIRHPSQVIWAGDTNKVWQGAQGKYGEVFVDWMRRTDAPLRGKSEQETIAWYRDFLNHDYTDYQGICPNPGSHGCKSLAYRHSRTGNKRGAANVVFCDGHVKSMPFGTVTVDNIFPHL